MNVIVSFNAWADAIDEIVNETRNGIIAQGFGRQFAVNTTKGPWGKTHFWKIINTLAKEGDVRCDEVVAQVFKGNNELLQSLVNAMLVEVRTEGAVDYLTASPLYRHCFKVSLRRSSLATDEVGLSAS